MLQQDLLSVPVSLFPDLPAFPILWRRSEVLGRQDEWWLRAPASLIWFSSSLASSSLFAPPSFGLVGCFLFLSFGLSPSFQFSYSPLPSTPLKSQVIFAVRYLSIGTGTGQFVRCAWLNRLAQPRHVSIMHITSSDYAPFFTHCA